VSSASPLLGVAIANCTLELVAHERGQWRGEAVFDSGVECLQVVPDDFVQRALLGLPMVIDATLRCAGSGVRRLHERDPSKVRSAREHELLLDVRDPLAWRLLAERHHFTKLTSRAAVTP